MWPEQELRVTRGMRSISESSTIEFPSWGIVFLEVADAGWCQTPGLATSWDILILHDPWCICFLKHIRLLENAILFPAVLSVGDNESLGFWLPLRRYTPSARIWSNTLAGPYLTSSPIVMAITRGLCFWEMSRYSLVGSLSMNQRGIRCMSTPWAFAEAYQVDRAVVFSNHFPT